MKALSGCGPEVIYMYTFVRVIAWCLNPSSGRVNAFFNSRPPFCFTANTTNEFDVIVEVRRALNDRFAVDLVRLVQVLFLVFH